MNETLRYKTGFNIMMDYFDCIPEEERHTVHKRLKSLDL